MSEQALRRAAASLWRPETVFWSVAGAALLGTTLYWLVAPLYPPLQDFPEWIYQGYLFAGLLEGRPDVVSAYRVIDYPVPNSLSQVGMGLLMLGLPPILVGRLWLAMYLVGFGVVSWFAMRKLRPDAGPAALVVILGACALNACFWGGYINFQVATLLFAASLVCRELYGQRSLWLLGLFALLIYFAHAAVFAAFVLWVGVRDVLWRRDIWSGVALAPAVAFLGWYVLVRTNAEPTPPPVYEGFAEFLMYKAYTVMKLGPFHNFVSADGTSWAIRNPQLYLAGIAANAVFALCLGLTMLMAFVDAVRQRYELQRLVLLLPPLALFAAFAIAPGWLPGIVNIGERFLIAAVLMMFLLAPLRPWLVRATAAMVLTAVPLNAAFWMTEPPPQQGRVAPTDATPGKYGYFATRPFAEDGKGRQLSDAPIEKLPKVSFQTSLISPKTGAAKAGPAKVSTD